MHRRTLLQLSTGFLALTAGCLGGGEKDDEADSMDLPDEATVEVSDNSFDPLSIHIASGGSVTWENTGDESYQIDAFQFTTSYTEWNYGEAIEPGESVTHTFEEDGLYGYTDQGNGGQYSICGNVRVGSANKGRSLPCE